jgi:hypothetical protein
MTIEYQAGARYRTPLLKVSTYTHDTLEEKCGWAREGMSFLLKPHGILMEQKIHFR